MRTSSLQPPLPPSTVYGMLEAQLPLALSNGIIYGVLREREREKIYPHLTMHAETARPPLKKRDMRSLMYFDHHLKEHNNIIADKRVSQEIR